MSDVEPPQAAVRAQPKVRQHGTQNAYGGRSASALPVSTSAAAVRPEPVPSRGFEAFYTSTYPKVFRAMVTLVRDRHLAEDFANEAFARSYESWARINNPTGYVFRVAYNLVSRWRRRNAREIVGNALELLGLRTSRLDHAMADAVATDVDLVRALNRLPRRLREVVVIAIYAECTDAEVADVLGITPGAAKKARQRARAALTKLLGASKEDAR